MIELPLEICRWSIAVMCIAIAGLLVTGLVCAVMAAINEWWR